MPIHRLMSDEALLRDLGQRIARLRLERNLSLPHRPQFCDSQPEPGGPLQPRLVRRGRGHRAQAPAARVLVRCA